MIARENQIPTNGPLCAVSSFCQRDNPQPWAGLSIPRETSRARRACLRRDVRGQSEPSISLPGADACRRYRAPDGHDARSSLGHLLLGDYIFGINCWVPVTTCYGTNALQCATLAQSIDIVSEFAETIEFDEDKYSESRQLFYEKLFTEEGISNQSRSELYSAPIVDYRRGRLVRSSDSSRDSGEPRRSDSAVSLDFRLVPVEAFRAHRDRLAAANRSLPVFGGVSLIQRWILRSTKRHISVVTGNSLCPRCLHDPRIDHTHRKWHGCPEEARMSIDHIRIIRRADLTRSSQAGRRRIRARARRS